MIIDNSIQEKLEKINSSISLGDIVALFLFTTTLGLLLLFIVLVKGGDGGDVVYEEQVEVVAKEMISTNKPFGSVTGKTYTFSWCKGSTMIREKNKMYFSSEEEARKSGRTLSKLCI